MIQSIIPVQFTCLKFFLHNLSSSPLWSTSWVWHPPCHTLGISSSSHCLLFATHTYTIADQISLPCNILFCTQLLHSLPLIINDIPILLSNGTNCLKLFQAVQILASTAALASPSTLSMSPKWQNFSTKSRFALTPISTLV